MVYRLDNQGVAGGPIMTVAGQQPDADRQGIASGHQPIAIVFDLMHPAWPGWRSLARRWLTLSHNQSSGAARSRRLLPSFARCSW